MPKQNEDNIILAPRPLEIKLADVLFFAIRKQLMIFKDLTGSRHVHYTMVMKGSFIDFHKTVEDRGKHIPLARVEFDWRVLTRRVIEEVQANWKSVFHKVEKRDRDWADLEVEYIPFEVLKELLFPMAKGARWDVDMDFLAKLESSITHTRLEDLADRVLIIGTASKGSAEYLVLSDGTECFLLNNSKMSKIINRSFEASISRIHLSRLTASSIRWYFRMRMQVLLNSAIRHFRKTGV